MRAASKIRQSLGRLRRLGPDLCSAELSLKAEFTPEVEQLETSENIAIDMTKAYAIAKKQQADIYVLE